MQQSMFTGQYADQPVLVSMSWRLCCPESRLWFFVTANVPDIFLCGVHCMCTMFYMLFLHTWVCLLITSRVQGEHSHPAPTRLGGRYRSRQRTDPQVGAGLEWQGLGQRLRGLHGACLM